MHQHEQRTAQLQATDNEKGKYSWQGKEMETRQRDGRLLLAHLTQTIFKVYDRPVQAMVINKNNNKGIAEQQVAIVSTSKQWLSKDHYQNYVMSNMFLHNVSDELLITNQMNPHVIDFTNCPTIISL